MSVTDDTQELCTPLVWNDVLLSSSGTYTYEGSTVFGCDSVVTIGFTLLEGTSSSTSASACDGYVWNDSLYTTSGTYDWQGTNVDSVATLELTVYDSWSVTDDAQEVVLRLFGTTFCCLRQGPTRTKGRRRLVATLW